MEEKQSEPENITTKRSQEMSPGALLDDRIVRWIGIPFFGIVIPSATGLMVFEKLSYLHIAFHFLYFMLLAFIVWQGNRWLLIKYYPVFYSSDSSIQKYVLMLGLNILFTAPIALLMLFGWKFLFAEHPVRNQLIFITMVAIVICVIFVTNIYEKVLFIAQQDITRVRTAELEQARIQAELEALRNQIDPHFMFNSLNGLSYLVEKDTKKAQEFIENLAEVYRYILKSKKHDLVFLREEMRFIEAYTALMKIRYEQNFQVNVQITRTQENCYLIPPVSIMVAVENAAKHNEISNNRPLIVEIWSTKGEVIIHNVIELKRKAFESNKVGLENLNDRFEKTVGNGIQVERKEGIFTLKMPLTKLHGA